MNSQNKLITVSGTVFGDGLQTASCIILLGLSGTSYIPLQCDARGILLIGSSL